MSINEYTPPRGARKGEHCYIWVATGGGYVSIKCAHCKDSVQTFWSGATPRDGLEQHCKGTQETHARMCVGFRCQAFGVGRRRARRSR